jgi:hypothetical protein
LTPGRCWMPLCRPGSGRWTCGATGDMARRSPASRFCSELSDDHLGRALRGPRKRHRPGVASRLIGSSAPLPASADVRSALGIGTVRPRAPDAVTECSEASGCRWASATRPGEVLAMAQVVRARSPSDLWADRRASAPRVGSMTGKASAGGLGVLTTARFLGLRSICRVAPTSHRSRRPARQDRVVARRRARATFAC